MMPYRTQGGRTYMLTLTTDDEAQPYVRRSSGTRDRATADQMQAMLDLMGSRGRRQFWIRDAVRAKRVTVATVYDHYIGGTLDALQATLADVDLRPMVTSWTAQLDQQLKDGTLAAETVRKYKEQVEVLVGEAEPVWKSTVTAKALKAALEKVPGSGTNRRRHAAAWTSLFDHCVEKGELEVNPLRAMKLPKSNKHREKWAEWTHAMRLVHAMPAGQQRALAAIRHGTGMELAAAMAMHRRDIVDVTERMVWAHGKKNTHRDRQVICLDAECWGIFWDYVSTGGFLPDAKLFPAAHITIRRAHKAALEKLDEDKVPIRTPYPLHASRSTFAVEMLKRGHDPKLIAQQGLGHANERLLLTLYGKYRPMQADIIARAKRVQGGAR
jgi:site-specific recombinase XerC